MKKVQNCSRKERGKLKLLGELLEVLDFKCLKHEPIEDGGKIGRRV